MPLDQPHYGIGPAGMLRFLRKYATFRGRASRSEFWWGQLTLAIASLVLFLPGVIAFPAVFLSRMEVSTADPSTTPAAPFAAFADALWGFGLLLAGAVLWLGLLLPWLALAWRRAQDAGMPGGVALAFLLGGNMLAGVLLITGLAQYVLGFLDSSARGARYERSTTPVLPPGVPAQAWEAERAMAAATRMR
ncbi:Protein of unknown function [Agrococcus jejuensis]|uniref:DUF805 domain-containing protein n=1 Tax=Agrococcus jejuensis TaxID=399736 RepID=A0A1G8F6L9_9MICO|nr:Protein of unknown function [Agrococcus jejuensis]